MRYLPQSERLTRELAFYPPDMRVRMMRRARELALAEGKEKPEDSAHQGSGSRVVSQGEGTLAACLAIQTFPGHGEAPSAIVTGARSCSSFSSSPPGGASCLGGCQLRIVPPVGGSALPVNSAKLTKVVHIAGDHDHKRGSGGGAEGTAWRMEQAEATLAKKELQRSRAFSSTKPMPRGYKEAIATEDTGGIVAVIGVKKQFQVSGKEMMRWDFWAQHSTQRDWRQYFVLGNANCKVWRLYTDWRWKPQTT